MSHGSSCKPRRNRVLQAAVVTTLVLLVVAPAAAASRNAQERTARKACLNGDYTTGVSILSELFVDTEDPTYIFNQGRCFEQNRRYEDAIGRFEEFMQAAEASRAGLSPGDKADAEKHIGKCREHLPQQPLTSLGPAGGQPPALPPPAITVLPGPAARPEPTPATPVVVQSGPGGTSRSPGSRLRTAGIITASVGGAAALAGVLLNVKTNSMINEFETTPASYTHSKDSDRETYKSLAWVGYGVGAVCVATGAVLFGIGLKARSRASTNIALVPRVGDRHAVILLSGGF